MKKNKAHLWFWLSFLAFAIIFSLRLQNLLEQEESQNNYTLINIAPNTKSNNHVFSDSIAKPSSKSYYTPDSWINHEPLINQVTDASPSIAFYSRLKDWKDFGPSTPIQMRSNYLIKKDTLRLGDSIYSSLKRNGIDDKRIFELNTALETIFEAKSVRPNDTYELITDENGKIQSFTFTTYHAPELSIKIERSINGLVGHTKKQSLISTIHTLHVRIETNLTNALNQAGESDALTDQLTDNIFGSVIDFSRNPRKGDLLNLIFEKKYLDNRFIRYGKVLMAEYRGEVVQQMAYFYVPDNEPGGYFDEHGRSLARQFLLYPLPFRGINSHFNRRRFHPILKRKVPHLGTDYAASTGTPVFATAKGTVTHAGEKGAYGLLVEISHANGYETRYAHLSKVSVHKGQQVAQQQRVGNVGSTGRSTGPHLHYEIIKNGQHINPITVNKGQRGKPLQKNKISDFTSFTQNLTRRFNNRKLSEQ